MKAKNREEPMEIKPYDRSNPPAYIYPEDKYYKILGVAMLDDIPIGNTSENNIAAINVMVDLILDGFLASRLKQKGK